MTQVRFYRFLPHVNSKEMAVQYRHGFAEKKIFTDGKARTNVICFDIALNLNERQLNNLFATLDSNLIESHANIKAKCQTSQIAATPECLNALGITDISSALKELLKAEETRIWLIKKENGKINLVFSFPTERNIIFRQDELRPEFTWEVNLHIKRIPSYSTFRTSMILWQKLEAAKKYFDKSRAELIQIDEDNYATHGYKIVAESKVNLPGSIVAAGVTENTLTEAGPDEIIQVDTSVSQDKDNLENHDNNDVTVHVTAKNILRSATKGVKITDEHKGRSIAIIEEALKQHAQKITLDESKQIVKFIKNNLYRMGYCEMFQPKYIHGLFYGKIYGVRFDDGEKGLSASAIINHLELNPKALALRN